MKITRLVEVCEPFAAALAEYDLAVLLNAEGEDLDRIWAKATQIAAAFQCGAAFGLGTTPEELPELIDVRRALNA